MEVLEARKPWHLEEENWQLQHIVAEQAVGIRALKALLAKSGKPTDAARSRTGDAGGSGVEPTTRLRADGSASSDLPLSEAAEREWALAATARTEVQSLSRLDGVRNGPKIQ